MKDSQEKVPMFLAISLSYNGKPDRVYACPFNEDNQDT